MANSPNELRLFISSTFRDLQQEREHLVKKIFPEIRAHCRKRGITFTEVDLRWGLTEEDAILGQVIRTCLEEVDRCRPYFIGMIGNRYGWVPELHEILMDPELLRKYPWIEEVALEGTSVTEMEFIHGVFDASPEEQDLALFYHRDERTEEPDDPERLAALIERARATGHPFRDFDSIERLGEMVREDLFAIIDRYWPVDEAPSPLELERRAHAAFSASRTRAYIPNPLYLKEFARWSVEDGKPLVVHGASGLGKSSLVAYLTDYYRKKNRDAFVVEHYVGASDQSGSAIAIMRHVIEEICEKFSLDERLPETEAELEKSFAGWLFRAEHLAAESGTPMLIVLDAVNQLGRYGRRLAWLPKTIPAGIRLIVSTTPGETEEGLLAREWNEMRVTPLDDERLRQSIVVRYLGEFTKGVSADQLRAIAGGPNAASPLFLRVVAEELRLHGEHETIDTQIARYTGADDLLETFALVLERIERDYGEDHVRSILTLIALSRSGLTETELLDLTGINRLELSRLLFAFDYHLIRRNGLLDFFHNYLRQAVERRYLIEEEVRRGILRRMTNYFEGQELSDRSARELMWGYRQLDDRVALAKHLSTISVFRLLHQRGMIFEVQSTWKELIDSGIDIESLYREGAEEHRKEGHPEEEQYDSLSSVCTLLWKMDYPDAVEALARELLRLAEQMGDRERISMAEIRLCEVLSRRGLPEQAIEGYERLSRLYEEVGDRSGTAMVHYRMGDLFRAGGQTDRALDSLQKALDISKDLEKSSLTAKIMGQLGSVYTQRGEDERALELFEQALPIAEGLGEKSLVALILGSIGDYHHARGNIDRSLAFLKRSRSMHQELGEKRLVAFATTKMSAPYIRRGDYDRALACLKETLTIHEELGNSSEIPRVIGNIGSVYGDKGDFEQSLEHLTIAMKAHREGRERSSMLYWTGNIARVLLQLSGEEESLPAYLPPYLPDYAPSDSDERAATDRWRKAARNRARAFAEECDEIASEFDNSRFHNQSQLLLARIDDADGRTKQAGERMKALLPEVTNPVQLAECYYWLWTFDKEDEHHRTTALRLYTDLSDVSQTREVQKRIEELGGAKEQA